ncbi:MAG: MarR family transcriptional regulator [Desulfocapsa sp.]|nr:MarR family transcriptional regulator [Desulfocapsa sp.]
MKSCDEESIGRLLYTTAQTMTLHAEKALKPYDLTVEQLHLLKNMAEETALSQQQLCEIVQKSAANVTRILDRLERKNYIRRGKNPADRRSTLLFLTPQGRELIDEVRIILESFSEQLIRGISQQEQEILSRLLHTMQDNLSRFSR